MFIYCVHCSALQLSQPQIVGLQKSINKLLTHKLSSIGQKTLFIHDFNLLPHKDDCNVL